MTGDDPLARYNAKRDFSKTAEPPGEFAPGNGHSFMVQKHDATRLHWDLRLEVNGVLKSWAVTRGPSLDPDEKRLAVRTEDHPLSYATFEGTIPKGEYGGGTVMLWDRGSWAPVAGKSAADIDKGHLHFTLHGERMKGDWMLIRLKPRGKERGENWLLRKIGDAEAGGTDVLTEEMLTSVATGRTMAEIAEGKKVKRSSSPARGGEPAKPVEGGGRKRGVRDPSPSTTRAASGPPPRKRGGAKSPPAFQPLQLCTLVDAVAAGSQWLHEVKYDGYRALVAVGGGQAKVFTRSGLDWSDKFAGIADAAAALPVDEALIDGEIVAFKDGRPDFSTLKDAIGSGGEMSFFAFDLLRLDGEDLTGLPNVARKERLRPLLDGAEPHLQFAEHVLGAGEKLFASMCEAGLEGVVSKLADAPYRAERTRAWVKAKCIQRQEFVIVGWTQSAKKRGFASLLLGVNEDGKLRYAGKVGTGFTQATMDELRERMDALARDTPTVEVPKNLGRAAVRGARWIAPELVAEVAYAEVTPDRVLRHSSFLGLRGDKPAAEVVAETPTPAPAAPAIHVKVSSREREIFPESTVTKGELADYYAAVAPIMLPWVANRPISLVRCPQGRGKKCFFQKHDAGSFGDYVHQVPVTEKDGSSEDYLYVEDADGLVACVQMGTIEFHGWGSTVAALEKPDRMVFDLDPDEELDFAVTRGAAEHLRDLLGEIGLTSFPLLSGGKGVHVVVPLTPQAEWAAVRDFAERFARALEGDDPKRFVANMAKAKRKGRIFVDYLRNGRGSTAIMPFSARARAGAPVSVPVSWSELRDNENAHPFGVRDAAALIERANGRGLQGWGVADQVLPDL